MLILFWVIVALVGVLLFRNTRYAMRQYLASRNRALFTIYMIFLLGLGSLLMHITARLMDFVQTARDIAALSSLPGRYGA